MSGPKRNPDSINTIGIVVIGVCASVLVYVTIVALQAFYMKDTADVQTMADYGGNDTNWRAVKATAQGNIGEYAANHGKAGEPITSYRVPIDVAMAKVLENAADPANLVPGVSSTTPSARPIFGRSQSLPGAPAAGSGSGSGTAEAAGSGSAVTPEPAAVGTGSAAAAMQPTGGQGPGGTPPAPTGTNTNPGAAAPKGNAP